MEEQLNNEEQLSDDSFILDAEVARRPKPIYPSLAQAFGLLGILILVNLLVSIPAGPLMMNAKGSILSSIIFFLIYVVTFGLVALAGFKLRDSYHLEMRDFPKSILPILAISTVALIIARLPLIEMFPKEWLEAFLEMTKDMFQTDIITLITVAVAAPILEEIIFRGIVLDGFLKRYSPWKSIFWSSVIFGLAHMNPFQFVSAFLIGLLMGWVYYKTKSLIPCIFIHFINNFIAFIPAFFIDDFMETSATPSETFGSDSNYFMALGISILIVLASIYLLKNIFDKGNSNRYS